MCSVLTSVAEVSTNTEETPPLPTPIVELIAKFGADLRIPTQDTPQAVDNESGFMNNRVGKLDGINPNLAQPLNRQRLRREEIARKKLADLIPTDYQLGAAIGQGDCFFDAIAQWLNKIEEGNGHNIKSLRMLCDAYARDEGKNGWVKAALQKDEDNFEQYLVRIQFTAQEMEAHEQKQCRLGAAIWGRGAVEGLMLCEELNIKLHIIEVLEEAVDDCNVMELLVDREGTRTIDPLAKKDYGQDRTLHLVVYGLHFVPLFPASFIQINDPPHDSSQSQESSSSTFSLSRP